MAPKKSAIRPPGAVDRTTNSSLPDAQANWHRFTDVERARAITAFHTSGVTYPKLAADLNYSESRLRHLVKTLEADPYDIQLAHEGQISTNELNRRASKAKQRRAAENSETAQRKRAQMGSEGARRILKWLASDPASAGNAEQITDEARFQLRLAEQTGGLPEHTLPIHLTRAEVIAHLRPSPDDDELDVCFYARWLALWTFHLFPSWAE